MKKWNLMCSITALLISNTPAIFSQSSDNIFDSFATSPGNWILSLGVGAQYPQWNNPMRVNNGSGFTSPYDVDLYSTENKRESVFAVMAGRRWERADFWLPAYSFGVFWQHFFRTQLGKKITLYSDPEFTNYKYNWELTANMVLASAKINLFRYQRFSPFFNVGIGSSFNRTSDYKEKALPGITPRESPGYANFSTSEFAYHVGAGIDFHLSPKLLFSVGYTYQDLGQISSGPGKNTWSNQSLNPGSYTSNEFLVSISYIFGSKQTTFREK